MKLLKALVYASLTSMLAACGGGGTKTDTSFVPTRFGIGYESWNPNTEQYAIHLARSDGTGDQILTYPDLIGAQQPSFSPDGNLLAYYKILSISSAGLFVMSVADGNATKIADLVADQYTAFSHPIAWRSDSGRLTFINVFGKTMAVDVDGSNLQQLTPTTPGVFDRSARFSPDGSRVVYERYPYEIWVSNSDGSNQVHIAGFGAHDYYFSPDWSPDGLLIVASRGGAELVTLAPDGTGEARLPISDEPHICSRPRWSPDGTMISVHATKYDEGLPIIAIIEVATGKIFWWSSSDGSSFDASWIP